MAPDAKLASVSCNAKPTMKPTTPRPAIIGATETPICESATNSPNKKTIVPAMEIIVSFKSCEIDWSECRSARSVTRLATPASQRDAIRIKTNSSADIRVVAPLLANQASNFSVISAYKTLIIAVSTSDNAKLPRTSMRVRRISRVSPSRRCNCSTTPRNLAAENFRRSASNCAATIRSVSVPSATCRWASIFSPCWCRWIRPIISSPK